MNVGEISNQTMKTKCQDSTTNFLSSLERVSVSKNAAFTRLAKKKKEKSKILQKLKKQRNRIKELVKGMKIAEAELEIVQKTIFEIEKEIEAGSDEE